MAFGIRKIRKSTLDYLNQKLTTKVNFDIDISIFLKSKNVFFIKSDKMKFCCI